MKKYLGLILSAVILLSSIAVNAETNTPKTTEEAVMSVELIENNALEEDIQEREIDKSNINSDESQDIPASNSEKEYDCLEAGEDAVTEIMSLDNDSSDTWQAAANIGTSRTDCELVSINGNMYAIGGMGNNGYLSTVERYNVADNAWQMITEIPNEVKGFGVVAYNSKIYIIGGYSSSGYSNTVQVYDVSANSWDSLESMNEERDQPATLCMNNKIYAFGGRNDNGFADSYEYYDFTDNLWHMVTTGFSETMIRIGAHAQYIDGYVCIYGGIDKNYNYAGVDVYSSNNLKEEQEIIGDGYDGISIAWGEDKALIFAWDRNNNAYDTREMTVSDGDISLADVVFTNSPSACKYSQYIIYNGYLYSIGGYNTVSKKYLETVNKYSVYYGDYSVGDGTINSTDTTNGNSITFNAEAGREYMLFINVKNIASFEGYTFKLEYPDGAFTVTDGCAMTADKDTNGIVDGAEVVITENNSNGISFECTESLSGQEAVTKSVNAVILKANASGQRTIKYSMVQE